MLKLHLEFAPSLLIHIFKNIIRNLISLNRAHSSIYSTPSPTISKQLLIMRKVFGTEVKSEALTAACHIVTPVGMLGYGFNETHTVDLLMKFVSRTAPTAIILDSGSTDSGPSKLANGEMTQPRSSYVRDLTKLLRLVDTFKVPLIFSSAGGDGSDEHVREMLGVIEEIAATEGNELCNAYFQTGHLKSDSNTGIIN